MLAAEASGVVFRSISAEFFQQHATNDGYCLRRYERIVELRLFLRFTSLVWQLNLFFIPIAFLRSQLYPDSATLGALRFQTQL